MSDLATIRRFLSILKPGELVELRVDQLDSHGRKIRHHGYYNDLEKLANDAAGFPGNCYVTVNRLDPDIPATNCLRRCKKGACTSAKDIIRRILLYLDADPNRPAGVPSTDAQHEAAIAWVQSVAGQLPFPRPLIGDSGNGACAFWRIDLPPDSPLVKQVLKAIKAKWETPVIGVDLTVASASRIGRLLGSDNFKGGSAGRQSRIIDSPDELELLSEAAMTAFAPLPKAETEARRVQQIVTSWTFGRTPDEQIASIKTLLHAKGIPYSLDRSPDSKGTLCWWFHIDCQFRPDQKDSKNWIKIHPTDGVSGGCFHAKCHGKGLKHILAVIAPELASQAAEAFDDSYRLARGYLHARPPVVIWQGAPHNYVDGEYVEETDASLKAALNRHIKRDFDLLGFQDTPNVTTKLVSNVQAALTALTFDRNPDAPHWCTSRERPASEFLLFKNGLLHVPSYFEGREGYFADPTPDFFSLGKLPYDFDEHAPEPKHFIEFCQYAWADANVHLLVEEILGDIILPDPRRRVFFVWTGRPRAGKSALAEATEEMVGARNRCAVDLHDFAEKFGLESVVGKKLILVSEAGNDIRCPSAVVEKIKKITGNDTVDIKRKFKVSLSLRLDTKILAVSNHLLKLIDDSGALFDRLIPLQFLNRIAEDKVDKQFPAKLKAELPGIVLLALKGWKRLDANKKFTMPESSQLILDELRETGSPVLAFLEERCDLQRDAFTSTEALFASWEAFCKEHSFACGKVEDFVIALKSAAPELVKDRQYVDKQQVRGFKGIRFKAAGQ